MQHIAVLDFGSQYTHLITRRIRELNVLATLYPHDVAAADLRNRDVVGIILSGGPQSVYDADGLTVDPDIFTLGTPILGICYGHQLTAKLLGGVVAAGATREYGRAQLSHDGQESILKGTKNQTTVWMSHGDTVTQLPPGFRAIGSTADCPVAAMANDERRIYGIQFHPEVRHSEEGMTILANFVLRTCNAAPNWRIDDVVEDSIAAIKKTAGDKNVFVLVSGGVDSSVAFALLTRALGSERVRGLYIDTGFMRKDESAEIAAGFQDAGFNNLETFDASDIFYKRLHGIVAPEEKRTIIGQAFLDVKDNISKKLGLSPDEWLLGQGTIYPDTIETGGTKNADTIKTHHNRVDAIQKLITEGKVIEPLAQFYKDEVRHIGTLLGLPQKLIERHPFPGPGLAIRELCYDATQELPSIPAEERTKLAQLAGEAGMQSYILPVQSVGVQGDNRTYAHPVALWGIDAWNELDRVATHLTNSVAAVNRALLWCNPNDEAALETAELIPAALTRERTKLLQTIDALVHQRLRAAGHYHELWQFPVILLPFGVNGQESVVLRPTVSQEAMTAHFAPLPHEFVQTITNDILATGRISFVFYDVTNKPPGTIEWE